MYECVRRRYMRGVHMDDLSVHMVGLNDANKYWFALVEDHL